MCVSVSVSASDGPQDGERSSGEATMKRITLLVPGVLVVVALSSCGGDEPVVTPPPVNQAPISVGSIPAQEIPATDTITVDVSAYFNDPDNDRLTYSATTSNASVATATVAGAIVSVVALTKGTATVTVTARDPGGLTAAQTLGITVVGKPGPLQVILQDAVPDLRAVVLRVEGPSIDSVQAGPDLVAYQVSLPDGVHAFVANPVAGAGLGQSDVILRFWSDDITELHNYVATVEQAAARTYHQIPVESVTAAVVR